MALILRGSRCEVTLTKGSVCQTPALMTAVRIGGWKFVSIAAPTKTPFRNRVDRLMDPYGQLSAAVENRRLPRSLLAHPQRYPEAFRDEGTSKVTQSLARSTSSIH